MTIYKIIKYIAIAFIGIAILGAYQGVMHIPATPEASWRAGAIAIIAYIIYAKAKEIISSYKVKDINSFKR